MVIFRSGCGMHLRQKECRQGRSLGSQSRFWRLCLHTAHVSSRFIGAAGVEEEEVEDAGGGGDISLMRAGDATAAVLSAEEEEEDGGGGSVLSVFGFPSVTLAPPPSLDVVSAWGTVSWDLSSSAPSFGSESTKIAASGSFEPPSPLSSVPEASTSIFAELSVQSWPLLSAIFAPLWTAWRSTRSENPRGVTSCRRSHVRHREIQIKKINKK